MNAFIEAHGSTLPIEFRILKYRPKPWQAEDSIVIANQMVKDLNFYTFGDAFAREKILAKLGPELTADLYVNRSWHDRPPTVMREDLNDQQNQGDSDDDEDDEDDDSGPDNAVTQRGSALEIWAQHAPEAVNGSNDWVVSGAHTVTGKPLLSNDMHLGHQMPNLWYEAHLKSGSFGCSGRHIAGNALRDCWTQSAHRLGIHQRRPHRDGRIHRDLQRTGCIPDAAGLAAAGAPRRGDSRQREAGCNG